MCIFMQYHFLWAEIKRPSKVVHVMCYCRRVNLRGVPVNPRRRPNSIGATGTVLHASTHQK